MFDPAGAPFLSLPDIPRADRAAGAYAEYRLALSCARLWLIFQHLSAFKRCPTIAASVSLIRNEGPFLNTVFDNPIRATIAAYHLITIHVMTPVRMIIYPRQENVINLFCQVHILFVIPLHYCPCFRTSVHTVMPKRHAHMFCFAA